MTKILSQSGSSLADVYGVEGSIAGIEQLETRDLPLVHEMGSTVFSERLGGEIVRLASGDIAQSTAFDVILTSPPVGVYRVLGVVVLVNNSARVGMAQVSVRDPATGREIPIFIWDSDDDTVSQMRTVENGGAAATTSVLRSSLNLRSITIGIAEGQPRRVGEEIVMRGLTLGFGAGTVETIALLYLATAEITQGGLSSRGLPVPSW